MAGKIRASVAIAVLIAGLTLSPRIVWGGLPVFEQPKWVELTDAQRKVLWSLKDAWDQMDSFRRKKWLGIADRYRTMTPIEQERIQSHMSDWVRLAPEERMAAREQYKKLKKVAPEQRQILKEKWDEYSALPDVTRDHMSDIAPKRPQVKTPVRPDVPSIEQSSVGPAKPVARSPLSPLKPPQSALVPKEMPKKTIRIESGGALTERP